MVADNKGSKNLACLFSEKSKELFGEDFTLYFFETVITAMLGNDSYKFVEKYRKWKDPNWFQSYYGFNNFDYIILVARKGYSIFRAFLRAIKAELHDKRKLLDEFNEITAKTILINTRTTMFYSLNQEGKIETVTDKKTSDLKVLIFDDLLGKGRNVTRITINLLRRGLEPNNIYYAAMGFHQMQKTPPSGQSVQSAWISQNIDKKKYSVNLKSSFFENLISEHGCSEDDVSKLKKINLFLPCTSADEKLFSSALFLERRETNNWSYNFNKFLHYCAMPYTGYMAYAYFGYIENYFDKPYSDSEISYREFAVRKIFDEADKGKDSLLKFLLTEKKAHKLTIESFNDDDYDSVILDYESNSKNGFYSSLRLFRNKITCEIIMHPYICLPTLDYEKIKKLYAELFSGITLSDYNNYNKMMSDIYDYSVNKENAYENIALNFGKYEIPNPPKEIFAFTLKTKNIYEHMSRAILSVLSAIVGIKIIEKYKIFSEDNEKNHQYSVNLYAKTISRYFGAHKRGKDNKSKDEIHLQYIQFLEKCYSNIHEIDDNQKMCVKHNFDFSNIEEYSNEKCPDIEKWVDYFPQYNKRDDLADLSQKLAGYVDNDNIGHLDKQEKNEPKYYLLDIIMRISEIDECQEVKIPPIPVFRIIEISMQKLKANVDAKDLKKKYGEANIDELLFADFMIALQSLVEDGSVNATVYSEYEPDKSDREHYISINALQCGEMSMLNASELLKDYGGWALIDELRSIYLEKSAREINKVSNDNMATELRSALLAGLKESKKFGSEDNKAIEERVNNLLKKIDYLFESKVFLSRIIDQREGARDSGIESIISSVEKFRWNYICGII